MAARKRRLLDALREPSPESVAQAKRSARKPAKRRARKPTKKAPPSKPAWPEEWVLGSVRCLGVTAKGTQCGRRAKPPKTVCGAHKGHTRKRVQEILKRQQSDAEVAEKAASAQTPPVGSEEGGGEKHPLSEAPDERRCNKTLYVNTPRERRCSRWTVSIDDGAYDDFCVVHSKDPRAKEAMKRAQEKGKEGLESRNEYNSVSKKPIFNGEIKTQDDVAAARLLLMRKLEVGGIAAAPANTLGVLLKDASAHIERFGTHQGAEGGAGVLRLLPGTKLVEMDTELDYVMTRDDLEKIEAGLAKDEKAGIPTPTEFDEIILKYLGKRTRGRDRSRYYED